MLMIRFQHISFDHLDASKKFAITIIQLSIDVIWVKKKKWKSTLTIK